ncbi:MAG: hypothetical protein ACRD0U_12625 [Acidimicrobiales bacterium]
MECVSELTLRGEQAGMTLDFGRLAGMLGRLEIHEVMVERVRSLRGDGYLIGLVTNNVREASAEWRSMIPVDELFDAVVDSCEVGMRKRHLPNVGGIETQTLERPFPSNIRRSTPQPP